jgi:hypothetical protein
MKGKSDKKPKISKAARPKVNNRRALGRSEQVQVQVTSKGIKEPVRRNWLSYVHSMFQAWNSLPERRVVLDAC